MNYLCRALNPFLYAPIAIAPSALQRLFEMPAPNAENLAASKAARLQAPAKTQRRGNIAVLDVRGVLVPHEDDMNAYFGLVSCERIAADLAAAMDDDSVDGIIVEIDSGGGSVMGLDGLAAAFRAARASKPILCYCAGTMCSAGYWLGSQCSEISISRDAVLGSIGVYTVVIDSSKAYESAGVKVNLVKAGTMKGAGLPGTPISADQLDESQSVVNTYYGMMVEAFSLGRKMSLPRCVDLADGKVYIGGAAIGANLADSEEDFDTAYARMCTDGGYRSRLLSRGRSEGIRADERQLVCAKVDASFMANAAAITAAFPKNPDFALQAIAGGKTLLEAKAEFCDVLLAEAEKQPVRAFGVRSFSSRRG